MLRSIASSTVAKSATWLMILQISSYVVPFLLLPYLTRVLGLEAFGELAVGWAVAAYAAILVDFGFFLWGARESAIRKGDREGLKSLYSNIQTVKLLLIFASFFAMLLSSFILGSSPYLYLFLWLAMSSQALMPAWLYQGMERNFWFLVFSIAAQVLAAVMTIFFVRSPEDLLFVPLCAAVSWSLFAFAANIDAIKRFGVGYRIPKLSCLKETIGGALPLFGANIWVAFYVNLPALAVGFLATKSEAAIFVGAQKIVLASQALFTPISSALFPHISSLAKKEPRDALRFLKKISFAALLAVSTGCLILYFFADFIVFLILGKEFAKSAEILSIMAVGPLIVAANVLLANHFLVAFGHAKRLFGIYMRGAAAAVFLSLFCIPLFGAHGAGALYVMIEAVVFLLLFSAASKISSNQKL